MCNARGVVTHGLRTTGLEKWHVNKYLRPLWCIKKGGLISGSRKLGRTLPSLHKFLVWTNDHFSFLTFHFYASFSFQINAKGRDEFSFLSKCRNPNVR